MIQMTTDSNDFKSFGHIYEVLDSDRGCGRPVIKVKQSDRSDVQKPSLKALR